MSDNILDLGQINSLDNKVVVVTGANSGIGFEIAKTCVARKSKVIIGCRNERSGIEAQESFGEHSEYIHLDLSSFQSIESFCISVGRKYQKVDILINNAGVMAPPFTRTREQLELTLAVNYIGYYFLTNKLLPLLKNVTGSRIVNMSSIAHYRVKHIDWDNISSDIKYNKREAYDLSNLFRIMFTLELERKMRQNHYETIAVACHPGVTLTRITRFMPKVLGIPGFSKLMNKLIFHTPFKASLPALIAAAHPRINGGDFVGLNTRNQYKGDPKLVEPNPLVYDQVLRELLWQRSIEITGIDLG